MGYTHTLGVYNVCVSDQSNNVSHGGQQRDYNGALGRKLLRDWWTPGPQQTQGGMSQEGRGSGGPTRETGTGGSGVSKQPSGASR